MPKLKILIAEDDADDRYFISLAFREAHLDHDLSYVKDGQELIQYLHTHEQSLPDFVLLDLNMPKRDGRDALREIRADKRFNDLNIVVFSTCISPEDKKLTASFGATKHITKPFEFSEMICIVKDICSAFSNPPNYELCE